MKIKKKIIVKPKSEKKNNRKGIRIQFRNLTLSGHYIGIFKSA